MKKILILSFFVFSISMICQGQKTNQDSDRFEKALEALEQNDQGKAFLLFNSWLMDHPDDTEAYWYRAILLEDFEQYENALTDYNSLLDLNPEWKEAIFARGRVQYSLGQYEKAKEDFNAFLLAPPVEIPQLFFRKPAEGSSASHFSTTQTENQANAYYYLALCSIALEENYEAQSYLDSAISHDPIEAEYFVAKGNAYTETGDIESAKEYYEKALDLNPDHILASQRLEIASQFMEDIILEDKTNGLNEFQENPEPVKQRGYYRLMNSDPEGAIADFNFVLSIDPGDIETMYYRGRANASLKEWNQADIDYSNSLELGGPNAEVLLARGQARYLSNRLDDALADFNLSIFHDQENPSGYYHRGITLHRMGKLNEACMDLLKARDLGMEEAAKAWEKVCKEEIKVP